MAGSDERRIDLASDCLAYNGFTLGWVVAKVCCLDGCVGVKVFIVDLASRGWLCQISEAFSMGDAGWAKKTWLIQG
jgi:hypothetical protein